MLPGGDIGLTHTCIQTYIHSTIQRCVRGSRWHTDGVAGFAYGMCERSISPGHACDLTRPTAWADLHHHHNCPSARLAIHQQAPGNTAAEGWDWIWGRDESGLFEPDTRHTYEYFGQSINLSFSLPTSQSSPVHCSYSEPSHPSPQLHTQYVRPLPKSPLHSHMATCCSQRASVDLMLVSRAGTYACLRRGRQATGFFSRHDPMQVPKRERAFLARADRCMQPR